MNSPIFFAEENSSTHNRGLAGEALSVTYWGVVSPRSMKEHHGEALTSTRACSQACFIVKSLRSSQVLWPFMRHT